VSINQVERLDGSPVQPRKKPTIAQIAGRTLGLTGKME